MKEKKIRQLGTSGKNEKLKKMGNLIMIYTDSVMNNIGLTKIVAKLC